MRVIVTTLNHALLFFFFSSQVKSMQMFRKPVKVAQQGDRVGICVTGLDPSNIERGVLAAPNSVPLLSSAICLAKKVRYFQQTCRSKQKFHISIGHTTVVATVLFFGAVELQLYLHEQEAKKRIDSKSRKAGAAILAGNPSAALSHDRTAFPKVDFPFDQEFEYQDTIYAAADEVHVKINSSVKLKRQHDIISSAAEGPADAEESPAPEPDESASGGHILKHGEEAVQYALLIFQHPILVPLHSLAIGSRLETDARESVVSATHCRIAFFGPVLCPSAPAEAFAPTSAVTKDKPRIFNWKCKECEILRLVDVHKDTGGCTEAIGWKLFSKEAGISKYIGLKLETAEGDIVGYVHSSFGSTGKFKIKFPLGVFNLKATSSLFVRYKRFIYDKTKAMNQENIVYTPLVDRVAIPLPVSLLNLKAVSRTSEEDDEEHACTPNNVAGFAIDSDGEDDGIHADSGAQWPAAPAFSVSDASMLSPRGQEGDGIPSTTGLADSQEQLSVPSACVLPTETAAAAATSTAPILPGEIAGGGAGAMRTGIVDSIKSDSSGNSCVCIVSGVFKMEENIRERIGATASSATGHIGALVGPYAKMGKCKVEFKGAGHECVTVGELITILIS
jgi:hypothetical protein